MRLSRYIAPIRVGTVVAYLGWSLQFLGLVLVPPAAVALIFVELRAAATFAALAGGSFIVGKVASLRGRPELELREALVVAASTYFMFSLLTALVFLPYAPFLDAWFEAMSGFTTTGLTTLNVADLPPSLLFFRAFSQWVGGAGIIVIALVFLSGSGRAPFRLFAAEFGGETLVGNALATARIVLVIYSGLTLVGFVLLWAVGVQPFDALLHIMTAVSTGGFSSHPDSIGFFDDDGAAAVLNIFMVLGALSLPLYYFVWRHGPKRLLQDWQLRLLICLIFIGAAVYAGLMNWMPRSILPALFQASSAATGTGFSTLPVQSWPTAFLLLAIGLMLAGGSAGSTSGGIKLYRIVVLSKLAGWSLTRVLLPREARLPPLRYDSEEVDEWELKEMFGFLLMYLSLFFLAALALSIGGYPIVDSLFESASALGTVGLSSGITSADAPVWVKLLLIFEMWVGRLEIFPVLVLLHPGIWNFRRSLR